MARNSSWPLAATVNGEPVLVGEVERELKSVANQKLAPAALAILQAKATQQLIDRRLIVRHLEQDKQAANPQEAGLEIDRLTKQLQQRGVKLADQLKAGGLDEPALRRQFQWQITWSRYLEKYLTDENRQKYFDKHRRNFDGTQIRAAHILWKVTPPTDDRAWTVALDKAKQIQQEIAAGKITFAKAAEQHSAAPTAKNGGDIGFISRHDPMPEAFSTAAFALEKDQDSDPVATQYGVHLIQCREIKPGQQKLEDVREELEQAIAQYLFTWLADKERPAAKIEFTGALPHFKSGTEEVVPAGQ